MQIRRFFPILSLSLLLTLNGSAPRATQAGAAPDQAAAIHWNDLGAAAFRKHDYEKASRYFSKALKLAPKEFSLIVNLAGAYGLAGHFVQARQLLEAALKMPSSPDMQHDLKTLLADTHSLWAKALGARGQYQDALTHYQAAFALDQTLRPAQAGVDLNQMGEQCYYLNRYQAALDYYRKALIFHQAAKNRQEEATTLNNMGPAYLGLQEPEKAIEALSQAQTAYGEVGDTENQAAVLSNLAQAYDALQQYDQAVKAYTQALEILHRTTGPQDLIGLTLRDLGKSYAALQQYDRAISSFQAALDQQKSLKDLEERGETLYQLGYVYYSLDQQDKAMTCYGQALDIALKLKKPRQAAQRLNDLGLVADANHQPMRALQFYRRALTFAGQAAFPAEIAVTKSNIGGVYNSLMRFPEAAQYYQQALTLERKLHMTQEAGATLNNLGFVYTELYQAQKAIFYLNQALPLIHEAHKKDDEAAALTNLMAAWQQKGQLRLAIFYGKQAVDAIQQIRRDNLRLDKQFQQSFLQSKTDAYRTLAELLIQEGRLPEAEQVLDFLKDSEFFDFVRRDAPDAPQVAVAALTPNEADWQARYRVIADHVTGLGRQRETLLDRRRLAAQGQAAFTDDDRRSLKQTDADLTVANQAFQAFLTKLTADFSADSAAHARVDTVKDAAALSDTLGELGPGAVALYTLVEPDKYRVVLVTSQTQKTEEYPITAVALNEKVAQFRRVLQDPTADPRPLAHELYTILFCDGKLARDLDGADARTLMWSLDGTLRYLPMTALYDGSRYLVERYGNEVFTPASNSRLTETPQAHWTGLGLGVSEAEPGFPALPGVPAELSGVIRDPATGGVPASDGVLPGTILLNGQFTQDAMVAALEGRRYPIVHIASHFAFRSGSELDSFLLLGDGSHLSLAQIKTLPKIFQGVDLLMLSACDTAVGGTGADGQEVEGFGVIAQRQGAKAVIASLWPVADQSTPLLMRQFYRGREAQAGTSKAEALRQAQLSLLRGAVPLPVGGVSAPGRGTALDNAPRGEGQVPTFTPDPKAPYAHPYYWAPFVLIGNWR